MKPTKTNPTEMSKVFLLSSEGVITVFANARDAQSAMTDGDLQFDSPAELKRVTEEWQGPRLVNLWNGLPGVVAIKKFTDRPTGLKRIWEAIQSLQPVQKLNGDWQE